MSDERGYVISALFRRAMLRELAANAYKGGWLGRGAKHHLRDLDYHVAKLKAAVRSGDTVRILEYAADTANHAMFLAHDVGSMHEAVRTVREREPDFVPASRLTYAWLLLRYPRKAVLGLVKPGPEDDHDEFRERVERARAALREGDDAVVAYLLDRDGATAPAQEKPRSADRLTGVMP